MTLKCLAVDDEPLALEIIASYAAQVDWIDLAGQCASATEAISFLQKHPVDLLLLDIQLPDLTGMEMLSTLRRPPMVIFTTAYESYAVESYTFDAVDYLVKPFSFERFLRAVQKASAQRSPARADGPDFIFIHSDSGDVRVDLGDILYIRGMNEYALVRSRTKEYIVRESLRDLESRLSPLGFVRVHKSWIVAIRKISVIDHGVLRIGDTVIPVGKSYRDGLREVIDRMRLG